MEGLLWLWKPGCTFQLYLAYIKSNQKLHHHFTVIHRRCIPGTMNRTPPIPREILLLDAFWDMHLCTDTHFIYCLSTMVSRFACAWNQVADFAKPDPGRSFPINTHYFHHSRGSQHSSQKTGKHIHLQNTKHIRLRVDSTSHQIPKKPTKKPISDMSTAAVNSFSIAIEKLYL